MTDGELLAQWQVLLVIARQHKATQAHLPDYDHIAEVPLSVMEAVDRALALGFELVDRLGKVPAERLDNLEKPAPKAGKRKH